MDTMKTSPSTQSEGHDRLFGQDFKGSPCHLRVLKPPGGGSSDIFGAPEPVESPRRARNASHLQSSVLGPAVGETPRAAKPDGNPLTGEGYSLVNGESQPMIAPVVNGVSNGPSSNGPVTNGSSNHATPQRSRVPPGGYSSGLW